MTANVNDDGQVICRYDGHTDRIGYTGLTVAEWRVTSYRDHETGGRATGRLVPQHVLYCRRHKWEFRITVDGPEAEARLAGTPLLSHPRYLKARQRVAEQLARYPGLPCHDSIVGTPDGRILVDGRPAPWGRSRLEFGDGLAPELLIA